jgi:KipI family sensor histidine kinase inhibitor
MRVLPVGGDAVLLEVASVGEAVALYPAARRASLAVTEIVPAAATVLFDGITDPAALTAFLERVDLSSAGEPPASGRVVQLPVAYDGPDLDDVAREWGMTRREAVATHTSIAFVVAFCGFAPGFAYCTGLPPELAVPRLSTPRPRVPAGSVAVAGEFTGVYPTGSPGGWRLLGRTATRLWDPDAEEPALLAPGTRVRFREAGG